MSELSSLFSIISEGQQQAAAEKAERHRLDEDRIQRLEPQVDGLNDLSAFFSVMSTKKKIDALPEEVTQDVGKLEALSSFFEQMSNYELSLDNAINASVKKPEVIQGMNIVEVPVEKVVEKIVFTIQFDSRFYDRRVSSTYL